jgi:cytochrome P450
MTTITKAPGSLPVVGHVVPLWRDPGRFLSALPSYGELVEIRIGPHIIIMVCDPALTRQVLLDDRTFDKGGPIFDRGRELLGNGLITCVHSEHRRQRRMTQPSFHHAHISQYAEIMARHVNDAIGSWRNGVIIDVVSCMKTIAARVITETVFSTALTPSAIDQVINDFTVFADGVYTRMFMPRAVSRLPIPSNRRYEMARSRMNQKVRNVIAENLASRDDRRDLLSALLAAYQSDTHSLSEAEINDQVMTFFFAGIETTAITLAWALHLIAQHPQIEERLHAEADTVLSDRTASYSDLPELKFTSSIIIEALRLYPPAWLATRNTTADTQLGGHPILAGSIVAYSPYIIHHRSDMHNDPEFFNPDRWVEQGIPHDTMIPFGGGARKCMGDNFALTEATLTLAAIAARWRLESVPGHKVRPSFGTFLIPRGLMLRTVSRTPRYPQQD